LHRLAMSAVVVASIAYICISPVRLLHHPNLTSTTLQPNTSPATAAPRAAIQTEHRSADHDNDSTFEFGPAGDAPVPPAASSVAAADRAGGLHQVFSEGDMIYLTSSADGGLTWKDSVAVNSPDDPAISIAASPSIIAGDAGRIGITFIARDGYL